MKKIIIFLFSFLSAINLLAQNDLKSILSQPNLVVGLVVDQMRWDYLTRYQDLYCEGGFRRLMRDGYNCNRCQINYIPAITAVGHSAIYTGALPAVNGIIGNSFEINGKFTYCSTDTTVRGLGTKNKDGQDDPNVSAGKNSPRNLLVTTIGDQLRLATNFRSKVIGVSLKDRAAIFPAGHAANAAYWMDSHSMNFVSSTYYMKELPRWAAEFNKRKLGEQYVKNLASHDKKIKDGPWRLLLDEDKYVQSAPRNQRWENTIDGTIKQSPWGQTITFDMAKAAIEGENLGHNPAGVADMITVSISSTDMIGHRISPNSIWMQDTYLRLDRDIADFLEFLDQKVGKGNYVIFLSADHGGSHNTEFRSNHSLPAETWKAALMKEELETKLHERFPQYAKIVESLSNMQVHLSKEVRSGSQVDEISQAAAQILAKRNEVAYAFPFSNIPQFVPEPIRTMAINGYCPQRSGEVCIIFQPRIIEDYASISELQKPGHIYKGTTHSLWNPDDTHIPLIFMGWHIPHAWDNQTHYICDIAATLASLLNIQQPNACVGENIIK